MKAARAAAAALALAAFFLPLSIAASNAALGLLAVAVILRLRGADRERVLAAWRGEPALLALAAYVAAGLVCGALGDGFAKSVRDSLKDSHRLASLALFVAAFALDAGEEAWAALAAGFSLAAAIGVGQSLVGARVAGALPRAHAFVHPVTFGEQMALAALGGLVWLARAPRGGRARAVALAATALCALGLALSQTRAAVLAFGVGVLVVAGREPRSRRWTFPALGLAALAAAAGEWLRYGRTSLAATGSAAGAESRRVLWSAAWGMFRDHPWTGVGPGHYATEFPRYFPGTLEGQTVWASAHDLYLHQLAERGLLGALVLLALFAVLLARAVRAERVRRDAASLWAAAAVPAFLVMNLTETAWQNEQFATLFLLVWALGTASWTRGE